MKFRMLCLAATVSLNLTACGGGGSSDHSTGDSSGDGGAPSGTVPITGSVIDGPMAFANIVAHRFTEGEIGEQAGVGSTDNNGAITGLNLNPENAPFILLVTSDDDTIDVTTGTAPVITQLKTIITAVSTSPIYATPLTSVASDIALANSDVSTDATELAELLEEAADQTVAALGFGLDSDVDIFTTPPVITAATTMDELADVAAYRAAIEALVDVVEKASANTNGSANVVDENAVLEALASDLTDGEINGQYNNDAIGALVDADITTEVESAPTVDEVAVLTLLEHDADATGTVNTEVIDDENGIDESNINIEVVAGNASPDTDGDTVSDAMDNCPFDANTNQSNFDVSDGDTAGDVCDSDDDNDAVVDVSDSCLTSDFNLSTDVDNDGCDDADEDADDDNDGVADTSDSCVTNDFNLSADVDGDGCDDADEDADDDNDGVIDISDSCATADFNLSVDVDGDGCDDANEDTDDDNDGVSDASDSCVTTDFDLSADVDGDGCDDANEDADDDNDGVADNVPDNCPLIANTEQENQDGDAFGDVCDSDRDGDGTDNETDPCPDDATDSCQSPEGGVFGTSSWNDGSTWQ